MRQKTPQNKASQRLALLLAIAASSTIPIRAADITKANNTTDLNLPASWAGGIPPGTADVALWNNTVTAANSVSLGTNLSWIGIRITNPGGDVSLLNDGNTLTLDAGGIDMSAATQNLTLNNALFLNSIEPWNIATRLTINGALARTDGQSVVKYGAGTLVLAGAVSGLWTLEVDAGTVQLGRNYATTDILPTFDLNGTASTLDLAGFSAALTPLDNGRITNSSLTASTLTLGSAIVNATIANGAGAISLVSDGATLMSRNTYSGGTTVKAGGLTLWFESATSNLISSASALTLAGGQLAEVRSPVLASGTFLSQTFASTALAAGESSIASVGALNLGAISRALPGSTLDFQPATAEPASSGIFTTASLTSSGILGGWASINGADWATRSTTSSNTAITPLAAGQYANAFAATANTDMTANLAASLNGSAGSLRFNSGSKTLTLSGANTMLSGGILIADNTANQLASLTITGGPSTSLTSGNGLDLIILQNRFDATLLIAARITDNGATSIALTKSGPGTLALSAANSFTGGTFFYDGAIALLPGATFGAGNITAGPASLLILSNGVTLPNNISGATNFSIPANGAATFSGNIQTAPTDPYSLGNADAGSLSITGTHISGSTGSTFNPGTSIAGGIILFAATGSLTSYASPITVGFDRAFTNLTLRDNASFTVTGLPAGSIALDMTNAQLTLRDNASINLGHGIFHAVNLVNLNDGSVTAGQFALDANTIVHLNGSTLIASTDNHNFFLPTDATSQILVGLGGGKFNTAGFSIEVPTPLSHDPALGAAPDGGLTLTGAGSLTLSAASTLTGNILINSGALIVASTGNSWASCSGGGLLVEAPGSSITSDGLTVSSLTIAGTHSIRPNLTSAGTSKVNSLLLTHTGSTYTATLDLSNNKLILQSSDPADKAAKITDLVAAVRAGRDSGWLTNGVASTTAAADPAHLGIGVFDNALLSKTIFGGLAVDTMSILTTIVHLGDANDNGIVDIQDLTVVANNWQQPRNNWAAGDLNDDGIVDIQDFTIVANNWQQTSNFSQTASPVAPPPSAVNVPEPATALFLPLALLLAARRRK